jgi:hypothetical protein
MKWFTLAACAGLIGLAGCVTNPNDSTASNEESYTPTGTAIPRKTPNRADMNAVVNPQQLENERTMGSANRDGQR